MPDQPEVLLTAKRFRVERRERIDAQGQRHQREIVVHPGAVVILPLLADGRVVLIRNYRVAVEDTLIELPAGTLEPDEDPAVTAGRELIEETGYRAQQIVPLCQFFMSPGILNERMHAYVATGSEAGESALESGEEIEPLLATFDETLAMIENGQIQDAKSIATILFYKQFRSR